MKITPDGNCLYSAVADQLSLHGIKMVSETLRKTAAEYMIKNSSEFMPFIDAEEGIISEGKKIFNIIVLQKSLPSIATMSQTHQHGEDN